VRREDEEAQRKLQARLWRIYGPTKPWYDKTWKIGDPVPVE
jgi:hypothetical protein